MKKNLHIKVDLFIFLEEDRTTPGWMLYRLIFWGSFFTLSYNIYLVHQH